MSDLLDTALVLARKGDTDALIELLQNARRWRSGDSSDGVRNLTGDQVIAALGYQPATQAEAGTGETTIENALGYVPAQSEGGTGLSGNENNKLNIAAAGVGKREVATELAGSGLAGGDGSPMAVDQTVARTDRDEVFTGDVALDDGAGTGGLLRGEEGTVEVRKQGSPTQYGRLRAAEVEVVDGNTATELRSQVVEISDSLLETNTDAAADAWGGLYTYRGRKEDATGTGLISKGIAWSPAAERFGQVDVDARKNDSGDNVGSGVQTSTFAPYARVNRAESITKDWTFGGAIGTGDFVSRTTGWEINQQGYADFRKMWADELKVQAFTADVAQALAGTEVLTKSRATLAENFTVPPSGNSATLTVEDIDGQKGTRAFEAGDTVRLRVVDRSGGGLLVADVWGTVSGYTDNGDGTQSWTYSVVDDGAADGKVVYEGAVALDWGTSGDGQIYSTVLDDAGSPYTDVRTWSDSDGDNVPDSYDTFVRLGVLSGISGLSGQGLYTRRGRFTDDILIGSLDKSRQYLEADGGTVTLKGTLNIIGGDGVSNLNDAGALATEDAADYNNQVSGGPPSDATKGASWGTDLGNIPTRFGDAPEGSGLYATANHFGYYSGTNWASVLNSDGSGAFAGGAIQWDAQGRAAIEERVTIGGVQNFTDRLESPPRELWELKNSLKGSLQGISIAGDKPANRRGHGLVSGAEIDAHIHPDGLHVSEKVKNYPGNTAFDDSDGDGIPDNWDMPFSSSNRTTKLIDRGYFNSFRVTADDGRAFLESNTYLPPNAQMRVSFYVHEYNYRGKDDTVVQIGNGKGDVYIDDEQISEGWSSVTFETGSDPGGNVRIGLGPTYGALGTFEFSRLQIEAYSNYRKKWTEADSGPGFAKIDNDISFSGAWTVAVRAELNDYLIVDEKRTPLLSLGNFNEDGETSITVWNKGNNKDLGINVRKDAGGQTGPDSFYLNNGTISDEIVVVLRYDGQTLTYDLYSNEQGHRVDSASLDTTTYPISDKLYLGSYYWQEIATGSDEAVWGAPITNVGVWQRSISDQDVRQILRGGPLTAPPQGDLSRVDQIQDSTYIQDGLIDTGLLDADAVTADKLFIDQTMTSSILAQDATIRGTLDMGDQSQNTWGKIRMGAGQNAFYLGDFALASQNSETGTLFGSDLGSGSGGASKSDGPKTFNFSQSTSGRTITVLIDSTIYANAGDFESSSASAEVTVELYDGNNNNYDTKKSSAEAVAVDGETDSAGLATLVWEAASKLDYVKVYRSVDSSADNSQAIVEAPITIYNATSEDFFGPQGGVWRRNGQPRIAFDVSGNSFSESTSGEGTVIADNHTTWSDPSIKEQAEEVTRGLDVVRGLRPARYTRIESRQAHFGFMADEVHQVIPEITRPPTTEQDRWAYNPMELLAPMVGAIQTVDDKTTELERRVGALEDRIDTLTANR